MNKNKFLEGLKEALQGEVSQAELNNQLLYYEKYIEDELRKGRTQEDIFGELGDPRLIARTIIETKGNTASYDNEYYGEKETESKQNTTKKHIRITGMSAVIIGILIIFLIILVIFSLVSALAPILIPLLVIILVISYFQKRR